MPISATEEQVSLFGPDTWSGKMSPERLVATSEKTSGQSSKKLRGLQTRMPLFLDLRGGWKTSGCIMGNGWSIAWRVFDAQFWGVPQRRRRIALVADFGGHTAPEILFERNGVCWDSAKGGEVGKGTAEDFKGGTSEAIAWYQNGNGECFVGNKAKTVQTNSNASGRGMQMLLQPQTYGFKLGNSAKARSIGFQEERSPTLNAECGGNKPAICYDARGNGGGTIASTMTGDHQRRVTDYTALVMESGQPNAGIGRDLSPTLNASHEQPIMCYPDPANTLLAKANLSYRGDQDTLVAAVDCRNGTENADVNGTLQAKESGGTSLNLNNTVRTGYAVRRLTPLEFERLQGFPDGWTDIGEWEKPCKNGKVRKLQSADSLRYKALGNSIAIPPWKWVLKRLCAFYERDATMASLFDGIGGFPLIWEQLNGKGSCLWASEVEEFPIAVTKRHFPEATP